MEGAALAVGRTIAGTPQQRAAREQLLGTRTRTATRCHDQQWLPSAAIAATMGHTTHAQAGASPAGLKVSCSARHASAVPTLAAPSVRMGLCGAGPHSGSNSLMRDSYLGSSSNLRLTTASVNWRNAGGVYLRRAVPGVSLGISCTVSQDALNRCSGLLHG